MRLKKAAYCQKNDCLLWLNESQNARVLPFLAGATIMPHRVAESFDKLRENIGLPIRVFAGIVLLVSLLLAQERVNAAGVPSQFNLQAQTACETEMLREMGAREVFSGKGYEVLTEVARAYGRAIPHIYVFPKSLNIAYIAASTAVDGRGKIVVGQQAIEMFDAFSLKGFLGHEMAHLVSDSAAQGCNDYILRNPQMEADADALAARTLGRRPLKALLQRVLAFTHGQNWEAKHRLELLQ
jgi:Zn-dependent protease with chaperone function